MLFLQTESAGVDDSWCVNLRWLFREDGKSMFAQRMQSRSGIYFYPFLHQRSTSFVFIQSNVQEKHLLLDWSLSCCVFPESFRFVRKAGKEFVSCFNFSFHLLTFEILFLLRNDECHLNVIMSGYPNMNLKFASISLRVSPSNPICVMRNCVETVDALTWQKISWYTRLENAFGCR